MTTINIILRNSYGRLAQREPFLISTESEVVLAFDTTYALTDILVKFTHDGEKTVSVREQNVTSVRVPAKCVHAGRLSVTVGLIAAEKVVKEWTIEPIILAESAGDNLRTMPELEEFEQRYRVKFGELLSRIDAVATLAANDHEEIKKIKAAVEDLGAAVDGMDAIVNDPLE